MANLTLTKSTIDRLPLEASGQRIYMDDKLTGFGLVVGKKAKTFIAQRTLQGRTARITIGKYGPLTPELARRKAQELLGRMALGEDVKATLAAARLDSVTLEEALRRYLTDHPALAKSTVRDYNRAIMADLADFAKRPLARLDPAKVAEKHRALTASKGPTSANKAMRVLRTVYNHATIANPDLPANPVSLLTKLGAWHRERRRTTYIRPTELRRWYEGVRAMENKAIADALMLALFTGMRRREVFGLRWEWIDLNNKVLTIPKTKNGDPLTLPLSGYVEGLLKARKNLTAGSPWVFPSDRGDGPIAEPKKAIAKLIEKTGLEFSMHDLRRTFITIAEGLDLSIYALKRLLNHRTGRDVTEGYIMNDVERLREPTEKIANEIKRLTAAR